MMWRYQWLILSALALVLTDASPHHSSSTLEKVAAHRRQRHHARAKPAFAEVQQKRGAHVEDPPPQTTPQTIKLSTTSKPMCSSEVPLLRQVFLKQRSQYFRDGEPYHGFENMFNRNNAKLLVPNGCEQWKSEDHCCSPGFFEGLSEAATSIQSDFAFVKYQYENFEQEVVNKAEEKATTEETKKRLEKAAKLAQPGLDSVLDFIQKCEDPLRRFFSFTACTLCTPGLDESVTEGQTLHWSAENCTTLKQDCESMPSRLKDAGRAFLKARDVLKIDKSEDSQEQWYNHATTWLDRAGKLALVRSKKVKFYATTDFCKLVEKEGYVYKPEKWGDVLMLHISSLATDEEKQNFLPKNQLHTYFAEVDQLSELKKEAEEVEAELEGEEAGEEGGSEGGVDTAGLLEVDAEEMTDAKDEEGLTLNCVNGEHRGSHCACQECYSGVECNKPMPQGPYRRQEFEPLVVQATAGAQQSLAVKGCRMHHDLRHQLARITLIPGHHELEHADQSRQDELCRVSNPHADALKMRIPQMVLVVEVNGEMREAEPAQKPAVDGSIPTAPEKKEDKEDHRGQTKEKGKDGKDREKEKKDDRPDRPRRKRSRDDGIVKPELEAPGAAPPAPSGPAAPCAPTLSKAGYSEGKGDHGAPPVPCPPPFRPEAGPPHAVPPHMLPPHMMFPMMFPPGMMAPAPNTMPTMVRGPGMMAPPPRLAGTSMTMTPPAPATSPGQHPKEEPTAPTEGDPGLAESELPEEKPEIKTESRSPMQEPGPEPEQDVEMITEDLDPVSAGTSSNVTGSGAKHVPRHVPCPAHMDRKPKIMAMQRMAPQPRPKQHGLARPKMLLGNHPPGRHVGRIPRPILTAVRRTPKPKPTPRPPCFPPPLPPPPAPPSPHPEFIPDATEEENQNENDEDDLELITEEAEYEKNEYGHGYTDYHEEENETWETDCSKEDDQTWNTDDDQTWGDWKDHNDKASDYHTAGNSINYHGSESWNKKLGVYC
eukprot:symbB.v1.2.022465.t1/scaffold1995.1/size93224/3